MRQLLMATAALSLALGPGVGALAQTATPAFQNNQSEAQRKAGGSQANAELFYMIQQLQGEIRDLRGRVEEQGHQIDRLSRQARDRYIDLDQRILNLTEKVSGLEEQQSASPASTGGEAGAAERRVQKVYRAPGDEERRAYNRIQALIQEKKAYDEAINALYDFIDTYPEGDLSVNAYYWLGEVYLAKPQLEQARQAFTIVATRYGDHRKAPDALYKLGVTLDRLGEKAEARERMNAVIRDYPDSRSAELARNYLESGGR